MDMGFGETWRISGDSAQALKRFGWADLCAQLVAAQDLRRDAGRRPVNGAGGFAGLSATGSFDHRAAALLAHDERDAEDAVNLTPSADGKPADSTTEGIGNDPVFPPYDLLSRRELP